MPISWKVLYDVSSVDHTPLKKYGGLSKRDLIVSELELLESTPEGQELFLNLLSRQLDESLKKQTNPEKIKITTDDGKSSSYDPEKNIVNISFTQLKSQGFVVNGRLYAFDLGSILAHESLHAAGLPVFQDPYVSNSLTEEIEGKNIIESLEKATPQEKKMMNTINALVATMREAYNYHDLEYFNFSLKSYSEEMNKLYKSDPKFTKNYLTFSLFSTSENDYGENQAMDFANLYRERRGFDFIRAGNYYNSFAFKEPLDKVLTSFDIMENSRTANIEAIPIEVASFYKLFDEIWTNLYGDERDKFLRKTVKTIDKFIENDCKIGGHEFCEIENAINLLRDFGIAGSIIKSSDKFNIRINHYYQQEGIPMAK